MNERTILAEELYSKLTRVLTEYEEGEANEKDLYDVLVEIQNNWELLFGR